MIKQVISGGQTGADQGALYAAKSCGIKTGGWMPKGFITQNGPNARMAKFFGMKEHESPKYPPRTFANVRDSDGTIRIANDFGSYGELCTMRALKQYKKPYLDIKFYKRKLNSTEVVEEIIDWIKEEGIQVLNVAGNAEKTAPGIQNFTTQLLTDVFRKLKG